MGSTSYSDEEDFVWIGKYSPRETRRLFEALEQANIDFRAAFDGFGAQIDVFIDPAQLYMIEEIKRSLFGEFSP
jgi:hypothetical protein